MLSGSISAALSDPAFLISRTAAGIKSSLDVHDSIPPSHSPPIRAKSGRKRRAVSRSFPSESKMAANMGNLRRLPLVVVLGSTGTGKSKLAIEIGKRIGGEILSADSMQVYKGLDIITNKVTAEELSECQHHLIDFVSPMKEFSVVEFRNMALPLIEDIKRRGKIPIVVGGTNYYIESVLWNILIDEESDKDGGGTSSSSSEEESEGPARAIKKRKQIQSFKGTTSVQIAAEGERCEQEVNQASLWEETIDQERARDESDVQSSKTSHCEKLTESDTSPEISVSVEMVSEAGSRDARSEEMSGLVHEEPKSKSEELSHKKSLYEMLREVDPVMADRLHPSDSRKIARSLQVYEQHGRPHSQILQEQREMAGGNAYGGPLRYEHTCVFWLQCQREILNDRLDKRVDEMLDRGLIDELLNFHREYNHALEKKDPKTRYTEGIFQSIGFKEFHEFLVNHEGKTFDESNASKEDKALLSACLENMKMVTRRYAKKQMTWVKNRFLARPCNLAPDVYGLDATDLENWKNSVLNSALDILDKLMKGEKSASEPLPRVVIQDDRHARHVCEICENRVILGEENWRKHLVSKSHKWHVKREQRNRKQNSEVTKQ